MDPTRIFSIVNVLPLPIWAVWVLAPSSRLARALARSLWPYAILGGVYLLCLSIALVNADGIGGDSFGSLHGVMGIFQSEWAALAGWVHYLCFDLFVGRWVMNDAPDGGYRIAPILVLTFLFGPIGLLTYIATRKYLRVNLVGSPSSASAEGFA